MNTLTSTVLTFALLAGTAQAQSAVGTSGTTAAAAPPAAHPPSYATRS